MKLPAVLYLLMSAILEACWNIALKKSSGIADWRYNLLGGFFLILGILTFKKAIYTMPLSIAIVTWSAVSMIGTIALDKLFYKARIEWRTAIFMAFSIISILGMSYFSSRDNS